MVTALPPHIYDTKSVANRKSKTGDLENRVFQRNRPLAAGEIGPSPST